MTGWKVFAAGCVLLAVLLCTLSAAGEICRHKTLQILWENEWCEDRGSGHMDIRQVMSKCQDCGAKVSRTTYGDLEGHVLHMAENLHFTEDYMHVCVLICPECSQLTLRRYGCNGNSCYRYHAVGSNRLRAQYLDDYDAWNAAFSEEACIQRWLEAQKTQAE